MLVAHWMDDFGARYSIPHGTWHLRIEAGRPDGSWTHFASYEIRRN